MEKPFKIIVLGDINSEIQESLASFNARFFKAYDGNMDAIIFFMTEEEYAHYLLSPPPENYVIAEHEYDIWFIYFNDDEKHVSIDLVVERVLNGE